MTGRCACPAVAVAVSPFRTANTAAAFHCSTPVQGVWAVTHSPLPRIVSRNNCIIVLVACSRWFPCFLPVDWFYFVMVLIVLMVLLGAFMVVHNWIRRWASGTTPQDIAVSAAVSTCNQLCTASSNYYTCYCPCFRNQLISSSVSWGTNVQCQSSQ